MTDFTLNRTAAEINAQQTSVTPLDYAEQLASGKDSVIGQRYLYDGDSDFTALTAAPLPASPYSAPTQFKSTFEALPFKQGETSTPQQKYWYQPRDAQGNPSAPGYIAYSESAALMGPTPYGDPNFVITGTYEREAYYVGRTLTDKTDCHAFADKTVISNPSDAGTYGTFDSTTEIAGTHTQSHHFSFQNRQHFSGEGQVTTLGGYISWPEVSGTSSTVPEYFHFEAKDVDTKGRFDCINIQYGIKVRSQTKGQGFNAAFFTDQDDLDGKGFAFRNIGTGIIETNGNIIAKKQIVVGASVPMADVPISWVDDVGEPKGFLAASPTATQWGVDGDNGHEFISNAAVRFYMESSSENYAFRPASGTQNLGTDFRSWNIAKLKQVKFTPIANDDADVLSIFVSNNDNEIKFKKADGTVVDLI